MGRYRQFFKRQLLRLGDKLQDSFARSDALLEFAFTPIMVPLWQTALSFKGNTRKSLNDTANLLVERKRVAQDQPVFAFVNLMGTHMPFHPKREYVDQFASGFLEDKEAQRYLQRFNSDVLGWLTPVSGGLDDHHRQVISDMYDAEVATQDEQLGEFFTRLESSGALDRTLVLIVADHGEHLGEKSFIGHSVSLYNELIDVPLIIRDPSGELPRGATVDTPVSTRRIFHTALTAAGWPTTSNGLFTDPQRRRRRSRPWRCLRRGCHAAERAEHHAKHKPQLIGEHLVDQRRRAVFRTPYKLILTGDVQQELYDFVEDPNETHDLSAALPDEVRAMTGLLSDYELQAEAQAVPAGGKVGPADKQLSKRLRALGYLE